MKIVFLKNKLNVSGREGSKVNYGKNIFETKKRHEMEEAKVGYSLLVISVLACFTPKSALLYHGVTKSRAEMPRK